MATDYVLAFHSDEEHFALTKLPASWENDEDATRAAIGALPEQVDEGSAYTRLLTITIDANGQPSATLGRFDASNYLEPEFDEYDDDPAQWEEF